MIIKKFSSLEKIAGSEGSEIRDYFSGGKSVRYSIAHFTLKTGNQTLKHKLVSSELYFIIKGNGIIHAGKDTCDVQKNDVVLIRPNEEQLIENTGDSDLEFLCIVDPAWKKEEEIILE